MQDKRYNESKKEIRSVLLTYPRGAGLDEFLKAYKQLLGMRVPSRELGFNSDIEFLRSMSDVVHISTNNTGRIQLRGIADESSEHIQKLVSKQRISSKSNSKPSKPLTKFKFSRIESNVKQNPPFVAGALRAEILQVLLMYPDGITFSGFVLAYRKLFNKYLSLEKGLETLENIISAIPELEIRDSKPEKKIYIKNAQTKNIANDNAGIERRSSLQQGTKSRGVDLVHANTSSRFDKSGIPEAVKKNFQMVLSKCPDGILAVHFPPLYEKLTGKTFKLHDLGYTSILELVDALPSIFSRTVDSSDEKNWVILPAHSYVHTSPKDKNVEKPVSKDNSPCETENMSLKICEGIPVGAASPFSQYKPPRIPENIHLDEYLPIFVSAIVNPNLFWFQFQTDDAIGEFEQLESNLGEFYNSFSAMTYKMSSVHIVIGVSCVVQCPEDKQWYRAVIKSIPSIELVNVLFVDYGSRENVPRTVLRYVKKEFFHFPAYAFRAELAGLKPSNNASTWDIGSQQRFIKLCESASIMAYLKPTGPDAFSTYLCDTNGDEDVHLNDILISEGYAELCFENQFDRSNATVQHQIHNSRKDEDDKEINGDHMEKIENNCVPYIADSSSYVSESHSESDKENFLAKSNNPNVKHQLVFSPVKNGYEKIEPSSIIEESKRYIKKVKLCEDVTFFIINMKNKPYISGGDLTKFFWNDKDHNFLAERLDYKDVVVPTIEISKEENISFCKQCKWFKIPDCDNSTITLYPLEWAFRILNIFGHPSVCLRLAIQNEIRIFDPADPIWNEFSYENEISIDDLEKDFEAKFGKLCLYDLKAKSEVLRIKRLKLLKLGNSSTCDEIKRIEGLQYAFRKRMTEIESICLQYCSCP